MIWNWDIYSYDRLGSWTYSIWSSQALTHTWKYVKSQASREIRWDFANRKNRQRTWYISYSTLEVFCYSETIPTYFLPKSNKNFCFHTSFLYPYKLYFLNCKIQKRCNFSRKYLLTDPKNSFRKLASNRTIFPRQFYLFLFSCSSSHIFRSIPPPYPTSLPDAPMTRWQGMMMTILLLWLAHPIARTARSRPIILACSQ